MPTRTVTVEISKPDPHGIRLACEEWCYEYLHKVAHLSVSDAADWLLRVYLSGINPRTTGADALSVTVHELPE